MFFFAFHWRFAMSNKLRGFNPFQSDIDCLEPNIIVNPKLPELVWRFGNYVLDGRFFRCRLDSLGVELFDTWRFHPDRTNVSLRSLQDFYVVDMRTGEVYPMYFVVPCGKCLICQNSKCANFSRRCQYETQLYDCPPVHITLTYDEQHLPPDKSVNVREVQLWKKRFRICLERSNYGEFVDGVFHPRQLRICVAAEYGKRNTRRPHYHVLIWNLKPIGRFTYEYIRSLAWATWSDCKGIPKCRRERLTLFPITDSYIPKGCKKSLAEMGKTSFQAFGYVAKYFYKEDASCVPPGRAPLFHLMSKTKGLGGIGAPFIDRYKERLRKSFVKNPMFLDKWTQTAQSMPYDRFFLNRVFPSKYTSVPYRVRKMMRVVCRYMHNVFTPDIINSFAPLKEKLEQMYPVLVVLGQPDYKCYRTRAYCSLIRVFSGLAVRRAIDSLSRDLEFIDIDSVMQLDRQRKYVLSKLFANKHPIDVYRKYQRFVVRRKRRENEFTSL